MGCKNIVDQMERENSLLYKEQSKIVWDIVKYDNGGTTFSNNDAIYCLKAEQGFYTEASADGVTADYKRHIILGIKVK